MSDLFHVLGSDVSHHNETVLRFFAETLSGRVEARLVERFLIVASDDRLARRFPRLRIDVHRDKRAIARAVCRIARDRRARFFLHGQFNPYLWLALLSPAIGRDQAYWHIWGADLYEDSADPRYRAFYPLRRHAQRRVAKVFATRGDLSFFRARAPGVPGELLYFPTRGVPSPRTCASLRFARREMTILVGNSGDRSNRHIEALRELRARFGAEISLIVPLGYPAHNERYVAEVRAAAHTLFRPAQVTLLTERLDFDAYADLLCRCDLGYFLFQRQQGIGTLGMMIQLRVPFVLHPDNPFCEDLREQGVPFLLSGGSIDLAAVERSRAEMAAVDLERIAFLPPSYADGWVRALERLEGPSPVQVIDR